MVNIQIKKFFNGNLVEYTLSSEFDLHKFFFEYINNKVNKLEFKLDKLGHRLKEYIFDL
ncbi:hypothetical protein JJB68_13065 [Clostridium perfringens]|uniref:hypothetical protein n=1 Tax=Clostridium perfringens TaxID=1502 RepID=UPI001ABBB2E4|nr:hypothetical protein [Clostridium perfringens]MBO3414579.1 hypothetical protein [Clostridium perfringens]